MFVITPVINVVSFVNMAYIFEYNNVWHIFVYMCKTLAQISSIYTYNKIVIKQFQLVATTRTHRGDIILLFVKHKTLLTQIRVVIKKN